MLSLAFKVAAAVRNADYGFIFQRFAIVAPIIATAWLSSRHITHAHFYAQSPTPLQFARSQGLTLKPETEAYLREFDNIRIIPAGSSLAERYCTFTDACNPAILTGENFANVPGNLITRLGGTRPMVFVKPYSEKFYEKFLYGSTGKLVDHSDERSQAAFKWVLLHEVGHIKTARLLGYDAYYALPEDVREAKADEEAQPHLEREVGASAAQFAVQFRGLTQFDTAHDVLPLLYGHNKDAIKTSFQTVVDECGIKGAFDHVNTAPAKIDQLYACLTSQPQATDDTAEIAFRKQKYVAAWNWFFKPQ